MSSIVHALPKTDEDPLYPSSDGEPMGETDWHMMALIWLREGLEDVFAERSDVKVVSDMFLYYREGDPRACKAPDIMVIKGVHNRWRRTFKTWVEKALPSTIIEIASDRTWQEDLGDKRLLYASLRIPEYIVYDPEQRFVDPPLQGFRLRGKKYLPLRAAADGGVVSEELGLRLVPKGAMLRLVDRATGQRVLTRKEAREQAFQRAEQESLRAEQEALRANQERQEKEREKQRADALEAELARLRAAARRKGKKKDGPA